MKSIILMCLLVGFWLPVRTYGGDIYGTLWKDGKNIGAGVRTQIICGNRVYQSQTNKQGSYRMFVPVRGRCSFTVEFQAQRASVVVASYDDPIRYDFELISLANGRYVLRRR